MRGLCCYMGFSLVVQEGAAPLAVCGFLIALHLLLWNTGPRVRGLQELQHVGSVVMHGVSFSTACGIFPDQGLNPCLLHWQVNSLPVSHQGNPCFLMAFLLLNTWIVRLEINSSTKPCLTHARSQPLCIHSHSTLCLVVSNHLQSLAWLSFLIDYIPGGKGHIFLGHHLAHNRCTESICLVNDR